VARMKRMTLRSNCWVIASRYNWKFRQRKSFSAGSERMSASPGRLQVFQSRRRIRGSPYTAFDRLGPFLLRPHSSIWLTEIPTMVSELISVIRFRGLSFQFRNAEKLRASIPASRGSGEIWRARRVRPSIEIPTASSEGIQTRTVHLPNAVSRTAPPDRASPLLRFQPLYCSEGGVGSW